MLSKLRNNKATKVDESINCFDVVKLLTSSAVIISNKYFY